MSSGLCLLFCVWFDCVSCFILRSFVLSPHVLPSFLPVWSLWPHPNVLHLCLPILLYLNTCLLPFPFFRCKYYNQCWVSALFCYVFSNKNVMWKVVNQLLQSKTQLWIVSIVNDNQNKSEQEVQLCQTFLRY